ncbi:MAG: hypothetical protein ACREJU_01665 [Nitrospiraceae bacterium]
MKAFVVAGAVIIGVGFSISLALGNPAMLPKHPGYPADKAVSPVTGQPLANDPGQTNVGGDKALLDSAAFDDPHSMQNLSNPENTRILEKSGAGVLPKVEGPQIEIEPPVKEGTRMPK